MNILKPGVLPANQLQLLRGTCTNCKAEVEFAWQEAEPSCYRNLKYFSVKCPTEFCFHKITVEA